MRFLLIFSLIGITLVHQCYGLYRCAEGWELYGNQCYRFNLTLAAKVTWYQARHVCEATGAQMISISSQEQQEYIQRKIKSLSSPLDQLWLGLYDTGKDDSFAWTNSSQRLTFRNWAPGEPSSATENCVVIKDKWDDRNCDLNYPYICEKAVDFDGHCPSGWRKYVQSCYFVESNITQQTTWHGSRTRCQVLEADLVTIDYPEENSFVSLLLDSWDFWIGLNDLKSEGQWRWNENQGLAQWYHWIDGQPNNGNKGPKDCAQIIGRKTAWRGKWRVRYCEESWSFICKANTSPVGGNLTCNEDWLRNGDFCYFKGKNLTSWNTARQTCKYRGGDLASIKSDSEMSFILENLFSDDLFYPWIGLHNNNGTQNWYWLNETAPIAEKNWLPWEPWESRLFTCVMIHATKHNLGKWNNVQCDSNFPFICQGFDKSASCRPPWKSFAGDCYMVRLSSVNWYRARQICQSLRPDADLVQVNSIEVQYFINGIISNSEGYGGFWVGLNSLRQWQTYEWISSNVTVRFENWDVGQPDHIQDDGCVSMYIKSGDNSNNGQWNNAHCFERYGLGCQTYPVSTFYDFSVDGVMYKFIGEQLVHSEAEQFCKLTLGDGATLATIESILVWHTLISNIRLHKTKVTKQIWVGSVDHDLLEVDDSAERNSAKLGVLHDVRDWCIYIFENTTNARWTEEYSLVKDSCYTRKYAICQKTSSILDENSYTFVTKGLEYLIIRDLTQVRPDLNTTCQKMMGDSRARVATLENDDQVMVLFTEIRAIQKDNKDRVGYWVDVKPQDGTLLERSLNKLPLSIMCPLLRLEKLSSDWTIQTAMKTVKASDCSEYHLVICQRNLSKEETIDVVVPVRNVGIIPTQNETGVGNDTDPTPIQDQAQANISDKIQSSCTGTCVALGVVLTIIIIICLCLTAALLYIKRRWICSLFDTAPDLVRLKDRSEPTSFTDPPPQPEEDATDA